jgi:hypothetical protein
MGCVTATAKRRRRQARGGYMHLAPQRRPHYQVHTSETYDRREAARREKLAALSARKGRKKHA